MRAKSVAAAGAHVHRGDLTDLESLRKAAAAADGAIHTGFNNDFSKFAENCEIDKRAIEVLGSALEGSDRRLLVTNGLALLAPGRKATEKDMPPVLPLLTLVLPRRWLTSWSLVVCAHRWQLERVPSQPAHLRTVHSAGYKFLP